MPRLPSVHPASVESAEVLASSPEALGPSPEVGALFLLVWAACGLLVAGARGRHGPDARPLAALGIVLGPLLLPLLREQARRVCTPAVDHATGSGLG